MRFALPLFFISYLSFFIRISGFSPCLTKGIWLTFPFFMLYSRI